MANASSISTSHSSLDARTLFLTTISAFSCLLKPTRNEIIRMDALLMPLYDRLNDVTKREVATKLSMSADVPPKMAMRLCLEPLEIAAPLLMTKAPLNEELLLRAVAKNGNGHLNIIAKRADLPASVQALIKSRVQPIALKKEALEARSEVHAANNSSAQIAAPLGESKADQLRNELREFMAQSAPTAQNASATLKPPQPLSTAHTTRMPSIHESDIETLDHHKLVRYAVKGDVGLLATRIADCLGIDHGRVRRMLTHSSYSELLVCLRALYCDATTAFAVCAPFFAQSFFSDTAAIALFYQRADGLSVAQAHQTLQDWRLSEVPLKRAQHANQDDISSSDVIFAQLSSAS